MPVVCLLLFLHVIVTTQLFILSLHDALPISRSWTAPRAACSRPCRRARAERSSRRSAREGGGDRLARSEEHTSELQSHSDLVCRLLLEKKKITNIDILRTPISGQVHSHLPLS